MSTLIGAESLEIIVVTMELPSKIQAAKQKGYRFSIYSRLHSVGLYRITVYGKQFATTILIERNILNTIALSIFPK